MSVLPHNTCSSSVSCRKMNWPCRIIILGVHTSASICSYASLNHLHALFPHLIDNLNKVNLFLWFDLLKSDIKSNKCTSPTDTSTKKIMQFSKFNILLINLQWVVMGPLTLAWYDITFSVKVTSGLPWSGTPWSGHAVYWNCCTWCVSWDPSVNCHTIKMV